MFAKSRFALASGRGITALEAVDGLSFLLVPPDRWSTNPSTGVVKVYQEADEHEMNEKDPVNARPWRDDNKMGAGGKRVIARCGWDEKHKVDKKTPLKCQG